MLNCWLKMLHSNLKVRALDSYRIMDLRSNVQCFCWFYPAGVSDRIDELTKQLRGIKDEKNNLKVTNFLITSSTNP